MVNVPLFPPLQETFAGTTEVIIISSGSSMVICSILAQPTLSVTVMEYVFALSPVSVESEVCVEFNFSSLLDQRYEYGDVPPEIVANSFPSLSPGHEIGFTIPVFNTSVEGVAVTIAATVSLQPLASVTVTE